MKGEMRLQVKANGMPQYVKKLTKMGESLDRLDVPMQQAGKIALAAVQSYPPYGDQWTQGKVSFTTFRPGSKYRRTQTLMRGWRGRLTKGSRIVVRYSVANQTVKYARYVQGNDQAAVHAAWWVRIDEWNEKLRPHVLKIFQDFMKEVSRKR